MCIPAHLLTTHCKRKNEGLRLICFALKISLNAVHQHRCFRGTLCCPLSLYTAAPPLSHLPLDVTQGALRADHSLLPPSSFGTSLPNRDTSQKHFGRPSGILGAQEGITRSQDCMTQIATQCYITQQAWGFGSVRLPLWLEMISSYFEQSPF